MSDEEFTKLVNGPLHHPLAMFCITRLALALRCVVDATGEDGAQALRAYCRGREQQDHFKSGE